MKKIKVLNLYAGIGGNRKLWKDVEVVAVENNKEIAKIYKDFFPNDKIVIADAHEYLLKHFDNGFDFIWGSPPCPTHSRIKLFGFKKAGHKYSYPDMKLYEEIIFLQHFCKTKWVIENVIPFYNPLVKPTVLLDRHYFWSNFMISKKQFQDFGDIKNWHYNQLQEIKGVNIDKYDLKRDKRDAVIRSYVIPELGKHIFDCAFKLQQKELLDIR